MVRRINPTVVSLALSAVALAAFAADTIYTVRKGDTLSEIASHHGVPIHTLTSLNHLKDADDLSIGQKLRIPGKTPAPSAKPAPAPKAAAGTYTVRKGDTLSLIAARYGTSSDALAKANGLNGNRELSEGQVLRLPTAPRDTAAPVSAAKTPLPASVKRQLDAIPCSRSKWKYIVVHHSATPLGSARSMDAYHRTRGMENGLAYHFVIGNGRGMGDGEIAIGSRWRKQIAGGHLASARLNEMSIGICLVGNFELSRPTERQLRALYALVNDLEERCRTPATAVRIHRQINTRPTECPGRLFPTQALFDNT